MTVILLAFILIKKQNQIIMKKLSLFTLFILTIFTLQRVTAQENLTTWYMHVYGVNQNSNAIFSEVPIVLNCNTDDEFDILINKELINKIESDLRRDVVWKSYERFNIRFFKSKNEYYQAETRIKNSLPNSRGIKHFSKDTPVIDIDKIREMSKNL